MGTKFIRRAALTLAGLGIACAALSVGASSCKSETAGEEVYFEAAVSGGTSTGKAVGEEFTTYAGWNVRLTKALVAIGPVYYYAGEAQASVWEGLLGIREAWACPTHAQYNKGTVLGEVVQQYVVDLLGSAIRIGPIPGLAGTCQSLELHLHPPGKLAAGSSTSAFSALQGHTVVLEGQATKEAKAIPFRAQLTLPDEGLLQVVESIPAGVALRDSTEQPGYILTEALVDQWFAAIEFDSLTERDGDTFLFTESTQAWTALVRGLRSRQSYRISWRAP